MAVPRSRQDTTRRSFQKAEARLVAEGKTVRPMPLISPGRAIRRTPGWELARHPIAPGGVPIDASEALRQCASKPWAPHARYLGVARSFHLFEYNPALMANAKPLPPVHPDDIVAVQAPYTPFGPDPRNRRR